MTEGAKINNGAVRTAFYQFNEGLADLTRHVLGRPVGDVGAGLEEDAALLTLLADLNARRDELLVKLTERYVWD